MSTSSVPIVNFFLLSALYYPWLTTVSGSNETDRLALLEFSKAISSNPYGYGLLQSWNNSTHFCNWVGVSCNSQLRVTSLVLDQRNLAGTLSPHIGNLTFLRSISLDNNSFWGEIPQEMGNLLHLQELNLTKNSFVGEIPNNLTRCSELRIIRLAFNNLRGSIPQDIGSLSKLEVFRLQTNNLTGRIPPSMGNLSKLIDFGVSFNNLFGTIPESLGGLQGLMYISLGVNLLSGTIPRSFFNHTSLEIIAIPWNWFEGRLPEDIGFTLPNLQKFAISRNGFSGSIPESLCNATRLQMLDMNNNSLVGQIPNCVGSLPDLNWLSAAINHLGTNSTGDLNFLTGLQNCTQLRLFQVSLNNFGGTLPSSLANLSVQLATLDFSGNQIRGHIPAGIEKFVNLDVMDISSNLLQGNVLSYITKFHNLGILQLARNQFSGHIPPHIGNLTKLVELNISSNRIEGAIPFGIGSCLRLVYFDVSGNALNGTLPLGVFNLPSLTKSLDLSHNLFVGNLPTEIGKLENLNALDVSHNLLSGGIPNTVGNCKSLEYLYLQGNTFNSTIPPSLASLKGLQELDLSLNNLQGEIPVGLGKVNPLLYLNLSFNHLQGEVPKGGIFANATAISLMGNSMLCGGVPELQLRKCRTKPGKHHIKSQTIILTLVVVFVSLSFVSLLVFQLTRRSKKKPTPEEPALPNFTRVSYRDLYKATDGFSSESLIGSGSFGTVYKGKLDDDNTHTLVAVKVLNLQHRKAYKSLAAECNALKNIRHRNLVRVVSYCSSLDHKGEEFRALVFELMKNGSLEEWLHPTDGSHNLSLVQRLNIVMDVASALQYLHDFCETPIIHNDLKPSNVLLDDELVAHVSDFGLAKFISGTNSTTSTIGVEGTVGYAAPEYGMGSAASKDGDVYSFGILVLEIFSGRRPTHEMFKDGLNLRDYIMDALPRNLSLAIDPMLVLPRRATDPSTSQDNEIAEQGPPNRHNCSPEKALKCLISVFHIGVTCCAESPQQRMKIADVVGKLHHIRDDFLKSSILPVKVRTYQAT